MNINPLKFKDIPGYEHQVLPQGIHQITESEFTDFFVRSFSNSTARALIDEKYANFRQLIQSYLSSIQWVDGSFVESKDNPNDVDVVFFVSALDWNNLPTDDINFLDDLFEFECFSYKTDAYLVFEFPNNHPQYQAYQNWRLYWTSWFSHTRSGVIKGFIELIVPFQK
jgi:hypothetical protein